VALFLGAASAVRAQIVEYPTTGAGPQSIVNGPDGALWFTESAGNKIGRITTQGVITEYALAGGTFPTAITEGSDGNLWFTEENAFAIGRITPTGAIQSFPMPALPGFSGLGVGPGTAARRAPGPLPGSRVSRGSR
jgi:virginiamycin B lyase